MNRPGPAQWTAAGMTALALHAAVLFAFLSAPRDGAQAPGLGGISIGLTLTSARAGAEADARELQSEPPRDPAPAEATPAPPAEVAALPPDALALAAHPVAETVTAVEPPPPVSPDPLPVPQRRPRPPVKPGPATAIAAMAEPAPAQSATPAVATAPQQEASRASTASQGRQDDGRKGHSADERDAQGGGPVGTPAPNYVNQLRYWLERHKTYPKDARRQRMQGVVHLYFRVTRDGRVRRHEIRKSSGHGLLDGEAEAMLERAQPLPEFTDDMKGGYLDVVVPVLFSLRGNS